MRKRPFRIGVVGAGAWGMNLIRNAADMGILSAVCDANPRALEVIRVNHPGVTLHCDVRSIARAQLDGIIVAAPAQLHAEIALLAIKNGKHVFVEKPLALNERDATAVVAAAEENHVVAMVGHVLLYHPAVRKILELVAGGAIGELRHMRARRWSYGRLREHENVWWSFAPHDVAVMLQLFGSFPERATQAQHSYLRQGACDFVYTDYVFSGGRSAHLEAGWLDTDKQARIDLFGDRGVISFIDSRQSATLTLTPSEEQLGVRGNVDLVRGITEQVPFGAQEPLRLELAAFCEAISSGEMPLANAAHGLDVVRALAMAEEASEEPLRIGALA